MNKLITGFCVLILLACQLQAARLQSVQIQQDSGKTSLSFSLDRGIAHKIFTLTNPDRVVVDFETTDLAFDLNTLHLNNELIRRVRSGHPNPHTLRLVFEVTDAVMLKNRPAGNSGQAFSFDISAHHTARAAIPEAASPVKSPQPIAVSAVRPHRQIVVVLDPGHGGHDPGAIGPKRSSEKNVTLAIAKKLKELINREPGMKAVLTREEDRYVALRERLNIARKHNADIFISIHADAFINQQSSGASVFALSQRGATSEAARWLAEKENYSELGGVNLKGLDDQSGLVRTVLIDLSQTATIGASMHMGEGVLRNLNTMTHLHNRRVEQARFMVLKSPDIPSILIETGFISNPREEKNLTSPAYQKQLTQAIFTGIKHYFREYPPHGSVMEVSSAPAPSNTHPNTQIHVVERGESLSKIAAKYRVSMSAIQAANRMQSTQVRIGQKLVLPAS